jgi:hypothetical protein
MAEVVPPLTVAESVTAPASHRELPLTEATVGSAFTVADCVTVVL